MKLTVTLFEGTIDGSTYVTVGDRIGVNGQNMIEAVQSAIYLFTFERAEAGDADAIKRVEGWGFKQEAKINKDGD